LKSEKVPPRSVASGIDFGHYRRIGLEMPNLLEMQVLSRTRLFFATVKVSSNTHGVVNSSLHNRFKCHAILFPHDAPSVASYMFNSDVFGTNGLLDFDNLKGLMQVYMVDDQGNIDSLFRHVFGTAVLTARPWVIAQWLQVLKMTNPYYGDLDLSELNERITGVITKLNEQIEQTTVRTSDPDVVAYEQGIGCDVAEVQNTVWVVERGVCGQRRFAEEDRTLSVVSTGKDGEVPLIGGKLATWVHVPLTS